MRTWILVSALLSLGAASPGVTESKDLSEDYKALVALMPKVAEALRPKDPQTADRILEAYAKAQEARTEAEIDAAIQSLETGRFFDAKERYERVDQNLKLLRDLLTRTGRKDLEQRQKELEAWRKELEKAREKQQELLKATQPQAQAESLSDAMGKAIGKLEEMIQVQKAMGQEAGKAPDQGELAKKAAELAEKLKGEMGNSEAAKAQGMEEALKAAGRASEAAARSMEKASGQMASGDPAGAQPSQAQAQKSLEEAKKALEGQKKRIDEQLAKGRLEEQKQEQEALKQSTERVAEEMAKPESQAATAAQKAQSASQSMGKASSSMGKGQAQETQENQEQALAQLDKAIDDLKQQEEEARREEQQQTLFRLAEELKKVLEGQRKVHAVSADLEKLEREKKPFGRPEQIKLTRSAVDQRSLAGQVSGVLEKLEKEEAEIFSWALKGVQEDMVLVASRLEKGRPDAGVLLVQADIEGKLEALIEALKEEAKKPGPPKEGGGGGGAGGRQPLVPPAAQLKFLRRLQAEVHQKTRETDQTRYTDGDYETLSVDERARIDRIAQEQGRIADITKQWSDKLENPGGEKP